MNLNVNVFWGSSDSDTFRCQTPPTLGLLPDSPSWDGLFDFTEIIDPKSSLALLQGPLPNTYEPPDEWLIEFKRLQDVHHRAQAVGVSTTSEPLYHKKSALRTSNISSHQPEMNDLYHPQPRQSQDKFARIDGQACVRDEPGCAAPSPTKRSCSTTGGLYHWNPTPAYDNQQTLGDHDVRRAMEGLREIEQNLQADTKRRMSQIQQSRPG
ncbi:hypothetical protein F4679DRAFT_547421 [Xylaria curta]|nr:hypothetical protein F4679DRAFT_547421 [Xylaria curta]